MDDLNNKPDEYWKKKLTPEQYQTLRKGATDIPFNNEYYENHDDGMYHCAGCGSALFSSKAKYESGSGWPSFFEAVDDGAVSLVDDFTHGMQRTEVVCSTCGGHLGHVFDDGPQPSCKRFCINSTSLDFQND